MKSRFNFGSCHLSRGSNSAEEPFFPPIPSVNRQANGTKCVLRRLSKSSGQSSVYSGYGCMQRMSFTSATSPILKGPGQNRDVAWIPGLPDVPGHVFSAPDKAGGSKAMLHPPIRVLENIRFIGNIPQQYGIFILVTMSKLARSLTWSLSMKGSS